ncbi:MAG: cytochrome c, partial [Planctomycetota bacterium]|nr:cytochrome c [Planctomycetota bacterium]
VTKPVLREPATQLTDAQKKNVSEILEGLFGTPDTPNLPGGVGLENFLSLRKLKVAAGPVTYTGQEGSANGLESGLYRRHCAHCHGVSGDGHGPTAEFLNPYPRDYRMGQFKFKLTDADGTYKKPSKADFHHILMEGIPGTAMPSFRILTDPELESIIDYVIYLAIRGQTERALIDAVYLNASDPNPSDDNPQKLLVRFDDPTVVAGDLEIVKEILSPVVLPWTNGGTGTVQRTIEAAPAGWNLPDRVEQGRKLFFQSKANCYSCHGQTAIGDGQTNLFDNWTNEHLGNEPGAAAGSGDDGKTAGIPLYFYHSELAQIGVVHPRNIGPRNLRLGNYRGGRRPIDIYQRITSGIEGTPMPGNTKLTKEEAWSLVAYVMSLPYEAASRPKTAPVFQGVGTNK